MTDIELRINGLYLVCPLTVESLDFAVKWLSYASDYFKERLSARNENEEEKTSQIP